MNAAPSADGASAERGRSVSVERTLRRALAWLAAPLAAVGIAAFVLTQAQVEVAVRLDATALPQFVAAQQLSSDVYALTNYAQQFLIVSTLAERATLQERIEGRAAGIDRGLGELQRLAAGDSPLLRQLAAARVDLTAGVADLSAAAEAVARNSENLRLLTGRLRGEGAQGPDTTLLAGLRELIALAAAAPTPLALRNIIRQFDIVLESVTESPDVARLAGLMRSEDGVAASRRRLLEALQQQRFIVRRQADAGDRMAAAASALAADAEQALSEARAAAVNGAERLRWLAAAGIAAGVGAALVWLRLLRRRVTARLTALNDACVAGLARDRAMEPLDADEKLAGDELDCLAVGLSAMQDKLQAQADELARLRGADPLTGLADRRRFFAAFADALGGLRQAGEGAEPAGRAALLLIDIDHFAAINEMLGVTAGDRALLRLAGLLRRRCGDGQLAARLQNDRFAVLLPGVEPAEAEIFAMRVRQSAADERRGEDVEQAPPVTVSIGVAQLDAADRSVDDAYRRAETALRRAQRDGRNRVVAAPAAPQQ